LANDVRDAAEDVRNAQETSLLKQLTSLQKRLETSRGTLPRSADDLYEKLRQILQLASRAEVLRTPPFRISRLLKIGAPDLLKGQPSGRRVAITGGPKEFSRLTDSIDCDTRLVREDGAGIHFTITVEEVPGSQHIDLYAYDFELYFPTKSPTEFIRFDLNERDHRNDGDGLRSHLHPMCQRSSFPNNPVSRRQAGR